MISSWRHRRAARRAQKEQVDGCQESVDTELNIPSHFRCPISLDLMKDPVTLSTGITYDRVSIETWLDKGNRTCPITKQGLKTLEPIPNHAIRRMIQDWCVENKSFGIERIPTPRVPLSYLDASEILRNISSACEARDQDGCIKSVSKVKAKAREGDRNKQCFRTLRAGLVLSSAFDDFSNTVTLNENVTVSEQIITVLPSMFPLDEEAKSRLGSAASLNRMVFIMKSGDLSARRNSVLALKEIFSSDRTNKTETLIGIDGALEALYKLIEEPICPTATKASLVVIYHMVTKKSAAQDNIVLRLVEMGMVNVLVESLVDSDRSICEKALGILDGILSTEIGKDAAYEHSLMVAVLVKKLLRVSDLATEFAVSALWKIINGRGDQASVEALQVGAFQKLLLLLQVGCGERTKEKATEMLKMLNGQRGKVECIDSVDFKDLKRPF